MSSIQVYSGPRSRQDTPSILMLFMREQPQLSERICVKMVRAAWRHSSLQALHLCVEGSLSVVATSAVHKLYKKVSRLVSPPATPGVPADGVALAWWLILEGGKCKQVLRQMDGGMLHKFPGPTANDG